MSVVSPIDASQNGADVSPVKAGLFGDFLRDAPSRAEFKDLREYFRRHTSTAATPDILTWGDGFKMLWAHTTWDLA